MTSIDSLAPRTQSVLRVAAPLAVGAIVLTVWQLLVTVGGVSDYLLPSPASIMGEFVEFAPAIGQATIITGLNSLIGLIIGAALAVVIAALASVSRPVDGMVAPIVAAIAVVPIVALAPVLNTMFGADAETGRQVIAGIASFVPVFLNTLRGLRQTQPAHRDLFRAASATPWQTFRNLTMPTAAPFILTGIRIASSLAVISALVAEYFGGPRGGLGAQISTSAASSAYARSWAYVLASIGLGLLFYLVTLAIERLATRHRG